MNRPQTELEASLLSRTRQMSRNEMESILKRYGVMNSMDLCHNEDLQQYIIQLTLEGTIAHAELM